MAQGQGGRGHAEKQKHYRGRASGEDGWAPSEGTEQLQEVYKRSYLQSAKCCERNYHISEGFYLLDICLWMFSHQGNEVMRGIRRW